MYLMGNHDERTAFAAAMLGDQGPVRVGATGLQECTVRGLRVIGLDSVVAGQNYGHLGAPQLDALADALATPAEHGTIVAMHHPPIRTPVPGIDDIGLDNPGALATAMAGGDVRMVVAGHTHHATGGAIGAIPVWVSGGCVYWSDAFSPAGRGRGVVGGQFSRIDVFDSSVVATAIPLGPHRPVYELDPVS
jgi:3',5'-cyclic AMP phosphodiesterase CpdA